MCLYGATTAIAAVANGIKALEHCILKEGMMDVSALVLGFEDGKRFLSCDAPRTVGMMLVHKAGEGFADDQTDIQRQAWIRTRRAAGTVEHHDVIGIAHDDRSSTFVGDDLFKVRDGDLFP